MSKISVRWGAVILLVSLLAGCSFGQMPTADPVEDTQPTFQAVQTQSALTVIAQLTNTAPTATPIPPTEMAPEPVVITETALPEPSATFTSIPATEAPPTAVPATPTNTRVPATLAPTFTATPTNAGCSITEQRPAFGADFPKNGDFDGYWTVKNTSKQAWMGDQVDIKYIAGTKFQTNVDILDLGSDVAVDGSYTVIVDMRAPNELGRYSSTWAFVQGGTTLCTLNLTIDVTE